MSELDALDPVPEQVKLVSGTTVVLEDLRARQFFKLLRIITHGALPVLQDMSLLQLNPNSDPVEFGGRLLSLLVLSIPDTEDETIQFVRSMCKPYGLIEGRQLNKADSERNNVLWANLDAELENPELDDLVTIIEAVVKREAQDIQALGKRLMAMFKLAQKTGQLDNRQSPTSETGTSSAVSPELMTFSAPNTDGQTTASGSSHFVASDNASRQSQRGATTPAGSGNNG